MKTGRNRDENGREDGLQDLEQMNSFLKAKCSLVGIAQKRRKKREKRRRNSQLKKGNTSV